MCCHIPTAESEGTLILPPLESFPVLPDDDAATVSSEDSFFSAAEVSSVSLNVLAMPTANMNALCDI